METITPTDVYQSTVGGTSDMVSNMVSDSNEEGNIDEKGLYKIVSFLFTYVYSVVIMVGLVCNIFCMVILSRSHLRQTSVSLYLLILAATDSLVLILDFLNNFCAGVLNYPIIGINKTTCNLYMFFFNVAFTYSSWLVVAITIERTIAVCLPMKALMVMSRKKAKIISLVILILVAGFLSFNLFIWESSDSNRHCNWAEGWEAFHQDTNMWLMGFSYSYIPSLILLVCNTLIVYQLTKASRLRQEMKQNQDSAGPKSDTTKITITVLFVSIAFLLLTAPLSAYYLFQFASGETVELTPEMALGEATMLMLGLGNHGINFWIYIITSVQYRKAFVDMWKVCRKDKPNKYVSNTASTAVNGGVSASRSTASDKQPDSVPTIA